MNCLKLLLALCCLFFLVTATAQSHPSAKYLNNVVELGPEGFGLIVGANPSAKEIYFVTPKAADGSSPSKIDVFFYLRKAKTEAMMVTRFRVSNYWLYLYAVKSTEAVPWQPYSYESIHQSPESYSSFIDNGDADSLWFSHNSKISSNQKISSSIVQLRVPRLEVFNRGMPIINSRNSLVGIIAEKQTSEENLTNYDKVLFHTIDMAEVQRQLDDFSRCTYFQLIPYGQGGTPCALEKAAAEQRTKEQQLVKQNNTNYKVAAGMSYNMLCNFSSGFQNTLVAVGGAVGMNVYLNPDGKFYIALKPRFTYPPLRASSKNYTYENPIGFKPISFRYYQLEVPVMLQWVTRTTSQYTNNFLGIGFSPGYQSNLSVRYRTAASEDVKKLSLSSTSGFVAKACIEVGIAGPHTRFAFFVNYQVSPWNDPDDRQIIEGKFITPAYGAGFGSLLVGIEISTRFKGSWALKSK